jgi:hypothetical protein
MVLSALPGALTATPPDSDMGRLRKINEQITRLAPAILASPAKGSVSVAAEGRQYDPTRQWPTGLYHAALQ